MVSLVSKMDRDDIDKITKEVGYAPVEIKLPKEVKSKKKKAHSAPKKSATKSAKTRRGSSNNNRKKPTKEAPSKSYGLPRPNYDGLSGGREGGRSGGVFGWVKKLFN